MDLSRNSLTGTIPWDIKGDELTHLDLTFNSITGNVSDNVCDAGDGLPWDYFKTDCEVNCNCCDKCEG